MPAAVAIPAAISGGSSILSAVLGSRAANKAADIQSRAAQTAATGYQTAGQDAIKAFQEGSGQANKTLADVFGLQGEQLAPWLNLGQQGASSLAAFMAPGGAGTQQFQFGADQFQTDPGYQFRLEQGEKALAASAAARGVLGTSGTLKGITEYGQNFASNEYQNAYQRALQSFQTNQQNTRANLQALIDPSMQALSQYGSAARDYGNQTAQNQFNLGQLTGGTGLDVQRLIQEALMGGANAQAAGRVGGANAWQSGLGGIANTAMQVGNWYQDKELMDQYQKSRAQNPSLNTVMNNPALDWGYSPMGPQYSRRR